MLLTYGIIGKIAIWSDHIARMWPVVARFSLEEAEVYLKALRDQTVKFKSWELAMKKHNPQDKWTELIEKYVEEHMLDKHFEDGTVYDIMCFKEDSAA